MLIQQLRTAALLLVLLSVVTGVLYPLVSTGLAAALFPHQAHGSLIRADGKVVGSELIGQWFTDPKYFWPRPSATAPAPYNAASSSGSNLGPLNEDLHKRIAAGREALRAADPGNTRPAPVDLVTSSASGLDPHLSPEAAAYQAARVARARGRAADEIAALIAAATEGPQWGLLGEPRVNVLKLNLALDRPR